MDALTAYVKKLICIVLIFVLGTSCALPALAEMNYSYTGIVYDIEAEDLPLLNDSRMEKYT